MYIWRTKKYNTRHKLAIAVAAVVALVLQIFPYKTITVRNVPADHGTCVYEHKAESDCDPGNSGYIYVIKDDRDAADKMKEFSTCSEYYAAEVTEPEHGNIFLCIGLFIGVADAAVIVIGLIYFIAIGIKNLFTWLFKDDE